MGYDVQFIQIPVPVDISFPVNADHMEELMSSPIVFDSLNKTKKKLLELKGTRPGPDETVDYIGNGMNYARLFVKKEIIHVENNCGAKELLNIYHHLLKVYPALLIYDLQSKQLHNAISYEEWWSRPL
ncbi:MAG: hypothetical protein ACYTF1_24910 [Planctomycetota bacterium]|jgi:hypothetical protein